jgi:hypothetical protein
MNRVSMPLPNAVANRLPGIAAIVLCFLMQSTYERFFCGGGYLGFWPITAFVLLPAMAFLYSSNPAPAVASAIVIIVFSFWANRAECGPSAGGGAPMAYVAVIFFGLPASIVVGLLAGYLWAKDEPGQGNEP